MAGFLHRLQEIVGANHVITDSDKLFNYVEELRGRYQSQCRAAVLPSSCAEIAEIIRLCSKEKISIVPQGGNTGAMGGAVSNQHQIILNTSRLNRIIDLDRTNFTMTVQSGCILSQVQQAARDADLLFPLSLGAQGSCQIGGNLATNAGGINVLQYGNTRDLVLGLEAVLPNGEILDCLNTLRKNNTGYDLKNLFIGSEGTLGIITAAVLKLFPYPFGRIVFLAGTDSIQSAIELMVRAKSTSSDRLTSCELMSEISVETAIDQVPSQKRPFESQCPWYVLVVIDSSYPDSSLKSDVEEMLGKLLDEEIIHDAVLAESDNQANTLVQLREDIVEAQKSLGGSIKHDVSVPVSAVPEFMDTVYNTISDYMPNAIPYPYGHLGDGNIHFNFSQPPGMDCDEFLSHWKQFNTLVHDITHRLGGSFSAEHGIGITKLDEMEKYKSPVELQLYRGIKNLLDPQNIMNPGKILR